jgi:hypothetical protein
MIGNKQEIKNGIEGYGLNKNRSIGSISAKLSGKQLKKMYKNSQM